MVATNEEVSLFIDEEAKKAVEDYFANRRREEILAEIAGYKTDIENAIKAIGDILKEHGADRNLFGDLKEIEDEIVSMDFRVDAAGETLEGLQTKRAELFDKRQVIMGDLDGIARKFLRNAKDDYDFHQGIIPTRQEMILTDQAKDDALIEAHPSVVEYNEEETMEYWESNLLPHIAEITGKTKATEKPVELITEEKEPEIQITETPVDFQSFTGEPSPEEPVAKIIPDIQVDAIVTHDRKEVTTIGRSSQKVQDSAKQKMEVEEKNQAKEEALSPFSAAVDFGAEFNDEPVNAFAQLEDLTVEADAIGSVAASLVDGLTSSAAELLEEESTYEPPKEEQIVDVGVIPHQFVDMPLDFTLPEVSIAMYEGDGTGWYGIFEANEPKITEKIRGKYPEVTEREQIILLAVQEKEAFAGMRLSVPNVIKREPVIKQASSLSV